MKSFFKKTNPRIYIFISGLLSGICVIFPQIGALAYFAMIPCALTVYKKIKYGAYTKRSAYADGFIFFMSYYLVAFHWLLYFYPLDFAGMSKLASAVVVGFAWLGLSLLQTLVGALNILWIYLFSKTGAYKKAPILMPFFVAALWAILEWTQTLTWAGVPWGRLALSQALYTVVLQTSSWFGSYFITFVIVLVNFLLAYAIFERNKFKLCSIMALCIAAGNFACGTVLYFIPTKNEDQSVSVSAVQGNLNSHEGVDFSKIFEVYSDYSIAAANDGADVILWPETAIPCNVSADDSVCDFLKNLAIRADAVLIVGIFSSNDDGAETNSLAVFYPDGTYDLNAYSKQRPVPFGEFVPMRSLIEFLVPPLANINVLSSDLTPGEQAEIISSSSNGDGVKFGPLICFDSIYENLAYESVRAGAEVLLIPTNDSWFYDSRGIYMHQYQAKLRAIETGRYIVRAGNTGISCVISDKGVIETQIDPLVSGYIVSDVNTSNYRTLYSYIGNSFVYLLTVLAITPFVIEFGLFVKRKRG